MAENNTKFIKGITVKENTLTPKEIEIIPGGTAGTKTTVQGSQTVDQTITLPNATDTLVGKATVDTLTNKTIDANGTGNSISNLEVADLAAGVLNTSTTLAGASDTQVPSALAVKTYVDNGLSGQNQASEISYNNTTSGLSATNVQDAIDEVEGRVDTVETGLSAHLADTVDAHDASAISVVPTGNIASTDVQSALVELQGDINTNASNLSSHTSASSGVHGVTGSVVGTTDTQVLTNKDIDGTTASNTSRITLPKGTKAALDALTRKQGTLLYASDEDKVYYDNGTVLQAVGSGASTLQQVYLNSTIPQLSLNATQGAFTIADASSPIGTIFEVRNDAGTVAYFKVDTTGASTTNFTGIGTVGAVRVHNLTTTQRDALTPQPGMVIYNTTTLQMQAYANGAWGELDRENATSQTTLNNGDSILISANHARQVVRIDGNTGPVTLSGTPFFNSAGFLNNTEVELIGVSDERAVTFVTSDVFKGLMGFSFTLGKNQVARLTYNAIVGRWLILSFSN